MLPISTRPQFSYLFLTTINRRLMADFKHIPHAFSKQEASQKFYLADKQRLFAPWNFGDTGLVLSEKDPVTKVYFPFWGVDAATRGVSYTGEYGITRTKFIIVDGKIKTKTETEWHPIQGKIGGHIYTPKKLCLYAGFKWDSGPIEETFKGFNFTKSLTDFNPQKQVDADTYLDQFLKHAAIAREDAEHRVYRFEELRAKKDIRNRVSCDFVKIHRIWMDHLEVSLSSIYLPGYTLEYPGNPPRIIPALSQNQKRVYGHVFISPTKVAGLVSALTTAVVPFLPPHVSLPIRIGAVVIPTLASALWAQYRGNISNYTQQRRIESARELNDTVAETLADKNRRLLTSGTVNDDEPVAGELPNVFKLNIDAKYFLILGLTPGQQVNERIVIEAFHQRLQQIHPDRQVNKDEKTQQEFTEKTRQLIQAKEVVVHAIRANKYEGKRFYSTSRVRLKEPLRSIRDPRVKQLIDAVLVEKDYEKASNLVNKEEIHPDSHDDEENTLITAAAKGGYLQGIRDAVNLGASLDTSCACPRNMTALHYGVENGDIKVVKLLLELGASDDLNNSLGQTPLDLATDPEIIKLLEERRAVRFVSEKGARGIARRIRGALFGYSSRIVAIPSGIYEPKALPRDSK